MPGLFAHARFSLLSNHSPIDIARLIDLHFTHQSQDGNQILVLLNEKESNGAEKSPIGSSITDRNTARDKYHHPTAKSS